MVEAEGDEADRLGGHGQNCINHQEEDGRRKEERIGDDGKILDCSWPCGLPLPCHQRLASKKTYVLAYGYLGLSIIASNAYFSATFSTIEKRFKMSSKQIGMLASGLDLGNVLSCMLLAYFGSKGHKTRWMALGAITAGLSCFLRLLPHLIYGTGPLAQTVLLASNRSGLCGVEEEDSVEGSASDEALVPFLMLMAGTLMLGLGVAANETLGLTFLDDNVSKDKIAILLSLVRCLRSVGPSVGMFIASYALSLYIDPSVTPNFSPTDPRWKGAWWLGWIPLGCNLVVLGGVLAAFPEVLPGEVKRRAARPPQPPPPRPSFKDFLGSLKRLSRNPVFVFNSTSQAFWEFGMSAYWVFLPKYLENQFRISASESSLLTGWMSLVSLSLGLLASGCIISCFKPGPRYIAAWNVFTESVDFLGHIIFMFLGCPKFDLHGSPDHTTGKWSLSAECNAGCDCSQTEFSPVCSYNTTTFYSPCHAGCTDFYNQGDTKVYTGCECSSEALEGWCPVDCQRHLYVFLSVLALMKFLTASGRAGNTIIQFRSVETRDKAISIALTEMFVCFFVLIPAPIIYGHLVDLSCLVWSGPGDTGNCSVYDGPLLSRYLNIPATVFLFLAVFLDIMVLIKVKSLQIYEGDVPAVEDSRPETLKLKPDSSL